MLLTLVALVLFAQERIALETSSLVVFVVLLSGFQLAPYEGLGAAARPVCRHTGGYRFSDFVRPGVPLTALMWAGYLVVIPRFFPF